MNAIRERSIPLAGLGLLTLRVVVGLVFIMHGSQKLFVKGLPKGFSYLLNDPWACVNCHIMSSTLWNAPIAAGSAGPSASTSFAIRPRRLAENGCPCAPLTR